MCIRDRLHTDDTPTKILSLMAQRKLLEAIGQTPANKAINTTGIIAVLAGHKVALFLSGHNHAGDNLNAVLAQRARELEPPIQMSDAPVSYTHLDVYKRQCQYCAWPRNRLHNRENLACLLYTSRCV